MLIPSQRTFCGMLSMLQLATARLCRGRRNLACRAPARGSSTTPARHGQSQDRTEQLERRTNAAVGRVASNCYPQSRLMRRMRVDRHAAVLFSFLCGSDRWTACPSSACSARALPPCIARRAPGPDPPGYSAIDVTRLDTMRRTDTHTCDRRAGRRRRVPPVWMRIPHMEMDRPRRSSE